MIHSIQPNIFVSSDIDHIQDFNLGPGPPQMHPNLLPVSPA